MPSSIASKIYADNDADITVRDLPTGLTPTWLISDELSDDATAVHADVSGTLEENMVDGVTSYDDILEGSAIRARLVDADPSLAGSDVYLYVLVGTDLRVYGKTKVSATPRKA